MGMMQKTYLVVLIGSSGGRPAATLCLFTSLFAARSVASKTAAANVNTGITHQ